MSNSTEHHKFKCGSVFFPNEIVLGWSNYQNCWIGRRLSMSLKGAKSCFWRGLTTYQFLGGKHALKAVTRAVRSENLVSCNFGLQLLRQHCPHLRPPNLDLPIASPSLYHSPKQTTKKIIIQSRKTLALSPKLIVSSSPHHKYVR